MTQPVALQGRPTRLLHDRIRELFRHLPPALGGDEEAVHQMRVAGRRLRVLLPLVARKPGGRRVRRARRRLRALIRTAAACRDLDVGVALFERECPVGRGASPDARSLSRQLRAARARSRRRMTDALLDLDVAGLRRDLRAIVARGADDPAQVVARVREAGDTAGAALLAALGELGGRFDPEPLHGLRTVVRRLRYVAEAQAELGEESRHGARMLKALQDELGQLHDGWVLTSRLDQSARTAERRGRGQRAVEARQLRARFEELSRAHHEAFLALHPADTVRQVIALGKPAEVPPLRLVQ